MNWGYSPCPRTNKSDEEWRRTFEALGLNLNKVVYKRVLFFFKQAIYEVEGNVKFPAKK